MWDLTQSDHVYNDRTANNGLINQWSATQVYVSKGFVYPFLYSVKSASDAPPEGYDAARAETILSAYEDADIPEDKKGVGPLHHAGVLRRLHQVRHPHPGPQGVRGLPRPGGREPHRRPHHQHLRRGHRGLGAGLPHRLCRPGLLPRPHQRLPLVLPRPGLHRHRRPPLLRLVLQPGEHQPEPGLYRLPLCGELLLPHDRRRRGLRRPLLPGAHQALGGGQGPGPAGVPVQPDLPGPRPLQRRQDLVGGTTTW